ncbi:MAG: hypothetical protein EOO70_06055 [Myxococcaceae bacterium]|nr:MAG: hypothetical protein EOO70_06055 [Myxococcaceae bacterium]
MENFTKRLQETMALRNLGVSALDHALRKADGYISNLISRGGTPRDHNLRAMAAVLAVHYTWLQQGTGERDDAELLNLDLGERFAKYEQRQARLQSAMGRVAAMSGPEMMANYFGEGRPPKLEDKIKEECSSLVWSTAQAHPSQTFSHEEAKVVTDLLIMLWTDLHNEEATLKQAAYKLLRAARKASVAERTVTRTNTLKRFISGGDEQQAHTYLQARIHGDRIIVSPMEGHASRSKSTVGGEASLVEQMAEELNEKLRHIPYEESPDAGMVALMQVVRRFHAKLEASYEAKDGKEEFVIRQIGEPGV